jgi:hypothetical protein
MKPKVTGEAIKGLWLSMRNFMNSRGRRWHGLSDASVVQSWIASSGKLLIDNARENTLSNGCGQSPAPLASAERSRSDSKKFREANSLFSLGLGSSPRGLTGGESTTGQSTGLYRSYVLKKGFENGTVN